jgi:hypothetical protein
MQHNKMYTQYYAALVTLCATRSETRFKNEPTQDPYQSKGKGKMDGLHIEGWLAGKHKFCGAPDKQASNQSCEFLNSSSSTIYSPLLLPFHQAKHSQNFTALMIQHYSSATHISYTLPCALAFT